MEKINKLKEEEINKAILEWLVTKNLNSTLDTFLKETNLKKEDSSKNNSLEKRWGTILTLQKKLSDYEAQIKQLKDDLETANTSGLVGTSIIKKENESMVINIIKFRVFLKLLQNQQ